MMTAYLSPLLVMITAVSGQGRVERKSAAADQRPRSFERIAEGQFKVLSKAFGLDEQQQRWLREELDRRVAAAREYERQARVLLGDVKSGLKSGRKSGASPKEFLKRFQEHRGKHPLNLDRIRDALLPHLTAEQRKSGVDKLRGIREQSRQGVIREYEEQLAAQRDAARRRLGSTRAKVAPKQALRAKPLLYGKAAADESGRGHRDNRSRTDSRSRRHRSTAVHEPARSSKQSARLSKSRSDRSARSKTLRGSAKSSDWSRLVSDFATKYKFSDAQNATAQAILKDCQRRADVYRKVHEADYARIEKMRDTKQRSAERTELDAPLVALGQELRERLEQIPTAQQRAAAESGSGKATKRKK